MGIPVGHESPRSAFLSARPARCWSWACRGGGVSGCVVRDLLCCAMSGVFERRRNRGKEEGGEMACARGSPGHSNVAHASKARDGQETRVEDLGLVRVLRSDDSAVGGYSRQCLVHARCKQGVDINWRGETKRCQSSKTKTGIWYSLHRMQLD